MYSEVNANGSEEFVGMCVGGEVGEEREETEDMSGVMACEDVGLRLGLVGGRLEISVTPVGFGSDQNPTGVTEISNRSPGV